MKKYGNLFNYIVNRLFVKVLADYIQSWIGHLITFYVDIAMSLSYKGLY
jgi:hypothetical protein